MSKQDRVAARTPADLERKLNYGKRFSEVINVANDAREYAEDAKEEAEKVFAVVEEGLSAQFRLVVEDDGIKNFSLIDGEATKIHFKSDSITIDSTNFTLKSDGTITAKNVDLQSGNFGNTHITSMGLISGIPFQGVYWGDTQNDTFFGVTTHNNYKAVIGLGMVSGNTAFERVLLSNIGIEVSSSVITWNDIITTKMKMDMLYAAHPELFVTGG